MADDNEVETTEITEYQLSRPDIWVIGGLVATGIGAFVVMAWAAVKEERRQAEEAKKAKEERTRRAAEKTRWFNEEYENGNLIYKLIDGSYLVVPRSGEQKRVIK